MGISLRTVLEGTSSRTTDDVFKDFASNDTVRGTAHSFNTWLSRCTASSVYKFLFLRFFCFIFPFLPYFVTQNFLATGSSGGRAVLVAPLCACLAFNWTAFTSLCLILSKYFSTFICELKHYAEFEISTEVYKQ
jgi:hypothetical protein